MGGLSIWHWLIFLVVALLLFGGSGKISSIMGDVAKGIKSFKKGMTEEEPAAPRPPRTPSRRRSPGPSRLRQHGPPVDPPRPRPLRPASPAGQPAAHANKAS